MISMIKAVLYNSLSESVDKMYHFYGTLHLFNQLQLHFIKVTDFALLKIEIEIYLS